MAGPLKAVVFDLDDTLYDCTGTLLEASRRRAARVMTESGLPMDEEGALELQRELADEYGPHFLVFDEIGRNGFRKVVIYNAHGGNTSLLGYLRQTVLAKRKPYAVFLPYETSAAAKKRQEIIETPVHGHACECETSVSLANHPYLVKTEAIKGRKADPLGRLDHLPPGKVSGQWYANYPDHYAGDATAASAEKGQKLRSLIVDSLADYIRAVKNDETALELMKEFYDRCDKIGGD